MSEILATHEADLYVALYAAQEVSTGQSPLSYSGPSLRPVARFADSARRC